jgi:hypothetical protein
MIMGFWLDAPASEGESGDGGSSGNAEQVNSSTRSLMSSVREEMGLPPDTPCGEWEGWDCRTSSICSAWGGCPT